MGPPSDAAEVELREWPRDGGGCRCRHEPRMSGRHVRDCREMRAEDQEWEGRGRRHHAIRASRHRVRLSEIVEAQGPNCGVEQARRMLEPIIRHEKMMRA